MPKLNQTTVPEDPFDFETPEYPAAPGGVLIGIWALFFSFVPFAWALRECTLMRGVRSMVPGYSLRLSFYFVCSWALVHIALIRPLKTMVYPTVEEKGVPALRVFIVTLFLALPLLSFSYYLSTYRDLMDLNEMFLAIVPAVVVTAFLFELTRASIASSLFLSASIFVPLFLFNDLLSPFATVGNYASTSAWFYLWRTLFPVIAVWLAAYRMGKTLVGPKTVDERLRNWIFSQWAILIYSVTVTMLVPMLISYFEKKTVTFPREFAWTVQFAALFCLLIRTRVAYRAAIGLSSVVVLIAVVRTALFFFHFEVSFTALFTFAEQLTVAIFYAWFLAVLIKGPFRHRFER